MTTEEIKVLFPIEGNITKKIIKMGNKNLLNTYSCIGALTLREALSNKIDGSVNICWGNRQGVITSHVIKEILISTEEDVKMMFVTEPQKVTFKIQKL